jgi:glycosyltransferase involved in cell wall biosynthesis
VLTDGGSLRRRSKTRRVNSAGPGVLIIIQNLPLAFDRRVQMECQALLSSGYRVSVICPAAPGDNKRFVLDGVAVYTYSAPGSTAGVLSYLWEFAYCWLATAFVSLRVWRQERFGAMQACNPPDTYWLLGLLWKIRGVRFVYDQHDLCPEVFEARFGRRGALRKALLLLERASYLVANRVIATNESYREMALTRGRRSEADVSVVTSAPDPRTMKRGAGYPALRNGRRYLCTYVGVMGPQDGVDGLLRAIDYYVHILGRQDCHFALLGFGDCLRDLRRQATDLDLDAWVTFTGRVEQEEISRWLSSSDLGVTPDPMCDFNDKSTMNKTLEYMAHELPLVAYNLTETRRSAGEAALYVEENEDKAFGDAIAQLLDAPSRRQEMGRIGRQRVESMLSWQLQVPVYVGVFDAVLGRSTQVVDLRTAVPPSSRVIDLRHATRRADPGAAQPAVGTHDL